MRGLCLALQQACASIDADIVAIDYSADCADPSMSFIALCAYLTIMQPVPAHQNISVIATPARRLKILLRKCFTGLDSNVICLGLSSKRAELTFVIPIRVKAD